MLCSPPNTLLVLRKPLLEDLQMDCFGWTDHVRTIFDDRDAIELTMKRIEKEYEYSSFMVFSQRSMSL